MYDYEVCSYCTAGFMEKCCEVGLRRNGTEAKILKIIGKLYRDIHHGGLAFRLISHKMHICLFKSNHRIKYLLKHLVSQFE
jgi:hypothetical protein